MIFLLVFAEKVIRYYNVSFSKYKKANRNSFSFIFCFFKCPFYLPLAFANFKIKICGQEVMKTNDKNLLTFLKSGCKTMCGRGSLPPSRPPPWPAPVGGGNVDASCPSWRRRGLAAGSAFGGMSLP